jgi:hypothetical protein
MFSRSPVVVSVCATTNAGLPERHPGAYRLALPCDEARRVASTDVIENRPEISTEHRGSTEYVFGSLYRLPHFLRRDSPRA